MFAQEREKERKKHNLFPLVSKAVQKARRKHYKRVRNKCSQNMVQNNAQ